MSTFINGIGSGAGTGPSMVATTSIPEQHQQVRELKQQIEELTIQVATLVQRTTPITPAQ